MGDFFSSSRPWDAAAATFSAAWRVCLLRASLCLSSASFGLLIDAVSSMKASPSLPSRSLGTQASTPCLLTVSLCEQKATMIAITATFGSTRAHLCTIDDAPCGARRAPERVSAHPRTIARRLGRQRFALCSQSDAFCSMRDALCSTNDALRTQKGAPSSLTAAFGPQARRPTSRASARTASAARITRQSVGIRVSISDKGTSTLRPTVTKSTLDSDPPPCDRFAERERAPTSSGIRESGSAVDGSHVPLVVPLANGRREVVQPFDLLGAQDDAVRGGVLLDAGDPLGAGNRRDVVALRE